MVGGLAKHFVGEWVQHSRRLTELAVVTNTPRTGTQIPLVLALGEQIPPVLALKYLQYPHLLSRGVKYSGYW